MRLKELFSPKQSPWHLYRHKAHQQLLTVLKPGDILVRDGDHRVCAFPFSRFVEWVSDSPYSHAAIVLEVTETDAIIGDAAQNGLWRTYLIDWVDDVWGPDIRVLRPKDPQKAKLALDRANYYIRLDLPFNTDFDEKTDHFYCIQFVHVCYEEVGYNLGDPIALKDLPRWNRFLSGALRLLGFSPDQKLYFVGNEQLGLMSSPLLDVTTQITIQDIERVQSSC